MHDLDYVFQLLPELERKSNREIAANYVADTTWLFHERRIIHAQLQAHTEDSQCRTSKGLNCHTCNYYLDVIRALFVYKMELGAHLDRAQHET